MAYARQDDGSVIPLSSRCAALFSTFASIRSSWARCNLSTRLVTAVRSRLLILLALPNSHTADSGCVMKSTASERSPGVDHVDGHRSPGYVISPYTIQNGPTDHTYYTQVNMTRTIEQILGLPPMNQFDLVASPMRTAFVEGEAPPENFKPWTHEPNQVPLDQGVTTIAASNTTESPSVKALRVAWMKKKAQIFAGKLTKPDAEDPDTVNHLNWYQSTAFTRPYPGEKAVRPPSDFKKPAPTTTDLD